MKTLNDFINEAIGSASNRFGNGPKPNITNKELEEIKSVLPTTAKLEFMKTGNLKIYFQEDDEMFTVAKYDDEHTMYSADAVDDYAEKLNSYDGWKEICPNETKYDDEIEKYCLDNGLISQEELKDKNTEYSDWKWQIWNAACYKGQFKDDKLIEYRKKDNEYYRNEYLPSHFKPLHGFVLRHKTGSGYTIVFKNKKTKWPDDVIFDLDTFKEKIKEHLSNYK